MAERYIRATKSSHLKLEPETGDVDVIIAAGLADSLGTLLLRCRQEWDSQRAAIEQADQNLRDAQVEAERLAKIGRNDETAARESQSAFYASQQDALTSRLLILLAMTTLRPAKAALARHATNRAVRKSMTLRPREIARCVGSALDIWLDQRCNGCEGRGVNGGYGAPQIICNVCKGTKVRRRVFPSESHDEYTLGEWLISEADRLVADAMVATRRNERFVKRAKQKIADAAR